MKSRFISNDEGCDQAAADIEYVKNQCETLLDLTDDEIREALYWVEVEAEELVLARAVIAAYKEKNK